MAERRAVIVGVGNPMRGDDGAGPAVARRVRAAAPPGVAVLEHDGEPGALLEVLEGVAAAILVDAVVTGAAPGTVHRFDVGARALPAPLGGVSTHGLGVADAIELARALGRLPERVVVFGIEGSEFGPRDGLSQAVRRGLADAAAAVLREAIA